ncbi:GBS Bsp-like repeat-containing protein [Streptococcus ilei]|uniref:GBS Bsp-like repeat-containing protein n=2 Tax=Streptococcus TaxID=1301 RepID=UPI0005AACB85|nr:GBS Bsp-like repeat-containing protein [Streptococcus ilei]
MRKKDFIYFTSAAVLLAASVQVAHADEVGVKESAVTESEAVTTPASSAPVVEEKQEVGTHQYVAPAPVTELPVTSSEVTKSDDPQVETKPITAGESVPSSESAAKPVTGTTTFYSAGSKAPSGRTVSSPVSADLTISNPDVNGNFTITAKNLKGLEGYKEVKIPFWSHANGMKDIVWYSPSRQTDGSYTVTANANDHENASGKYEAQVFYVDQQGRNTFVKKAFVDRAKPSADLSISNPDSNGNFTITAKNLKGFEGYKEVKIPFWSHANGMKDIVWYSPSRQTDGSYTVTANANDHENASGKYEAQVFYVDQQGRNTFVKKAFVDRAKPSADLSISNPDSNGNFTITAKNLKGFEGYKEVKIPFWSQANGMKDIVWYSPSRQADGSYTVTANVSDHENASGKYEAQLFYVDQQGRNTFVKKAFVDRAKPSADITISKNEVEGTFTITAKNLKGFEGYKEVKIPFWSQANGMKDIVWYSPSRQADGSYTVTAKASDHENANGQYEAQLFYVDHKGQNTFVKKTFVQYEGKTSPTGTITIQNNNKDTGTFDVIIKDVYSPKGVRTIQVPTWSDKDGQDDIRWYEATRQANGDYKVSVKASDHKNSTGKYHVHLYYIQNDGSRVGAGTTTTEVEFRNLTTKTQTGIKNVNSGAGTFTVTVDQAPQGRRIKNIRVAAWSQAHQENLYWYTTAPSGTHTEVQVSAANHQYQKGNYTTHVYVDYVDGGVEGFDLGQTALSPRETVDQAAYTPRVTNGQRDRVLRAAANLVGVRSGSAAHHQLVKDYNSINPLPVGYAVKNSDDWCDVFVTTVFQREGLSHLIGRECGVERHIQIFKRLGIWNEDGASTPKAGDIITFNWDQYSQPNDGFADHIGIVERVENGLIHTIEGNSGVVGTVKRNVYRIGHGNIRGFATPRYK